jgi:hypothetical protein
MIQLSTLRGDCHLSVQQTPPCSQISSSTSEGVSLSAANLLVVEAKKKPCLGTATDYDRHRLVAYLDELNYRHAVFLMLE